MSSSDNTSILDGFKRCSKCKEIKFQTEFSKRVVTKDGLDLWCKACKRGSKIPKTGPVRFWSHVDKSCIDGCWEWTGSINRYGYGKSYLNKKGVTAHRHSWLLAHGPIPEDLCVCHHCDNRRCVNPSHLFLGTTQDNTRDKVEKGRCQPQDGELNPYHKIIEQDVRDIRSLANNGVSQHEIAKRWGITQSNVSCIVNRKTWRHIE